MSTLRTNYSRWIIVGGITCIVLAASAVYWPCRHGDFLWDGELLITKNPLVKTPEGLYRIWFTQEPVDYWPVTNSMFWIQWHLWGTNTAGYHATNLLLHIANALLLWLILRRLSLSGAFLAALLFAVHPVNVESVAWIAQLKNVLSMFFFLLSVLWYLKADPDLAPGNQPAPSQSLDGMQARRWSYRWYCLSLSAFTLAMLSKGSVAILPLLLLLVVWWRRNRITRLDLARTAPFFLVAAVLSVVNIWFQTHGSGETIRVVTPLQRLLGAGAVPWFYLYKALMPMNLAFVYPQWNIDPSNPLWWLPLAATILVTVLLIWQRRRKFIRRLLVAWLFFCIALLPVMGLIDIYYMKFSLVADHYQYIAIISVLVLAAAAITVFMQRWPKGMTITVGAILTAAFAILAREQTRIYVDSEALNQSIVEKNPNCWLAYINRGITLFNTGQVDAAIANYEKALQIDADIVEGQNGLGVALAKQGNYQAAIEHYLQALQIKPDYAEAHGNLGLALAEMGSSEEAVEELQRALKLQPNLPEVSFNLAHQLKQMGHVQAAIRQYQVTLRLDPDNPQVHNNLGVLLAATGQPKQALEQYNEALRLNPQEPEARCNLAKVLADLNKPLEAIEQYQQVLQIDPKFTDAYYGLGTVYLKTKQFPKAIEEYEHALRVNPDYAEAHSNLGAALAQNGQLHEAIEHYRQAIQLKPEYVEAQANLATSLAQLNRREEAIAAAEKAIALARSQGKQALAAQIEHWLDSYRSAPSPSGEK